MVGEPGPAALAAVNQERRLLIIDDDTLFRDRLARAMEHRGFTVATADAVASGASAESVASVISKDPNVTFAQPVAR